ncbi:MAG: acyl-CoA thioesterase [Tannerella sp.]|jgi:acyl-CoA thioester hydrolase|nr:acyl-CoA thioesterase [Tannerella sp.]
MDKPLCETIRVRVRFSEVDALRMVWHGCYVQYLEDAREAFGRKYGLTYMHIFNSGYVAPIVDLQLQYRQPATIDDVLLIEITCRPVRGGKLIFDYRICKEPDGSLILTASTIQLFMTREGVFEPSSPDFFNEWKEKMSGQANLELLNS